MGYLFPLSLQSQQTALFEVKLINGLREVEVGLGELFEVEALGGVAVLVEVAG